MQSLADLDLPLLPLRDPAFAEDPFPHFAAARRQHPWLARWEFGPIVTQYEAVRELIRLEPAKLRTPYEQFATAMEAEDTNWGRFQRCQMLAYNGEAHQRLRNILAPAFTPRQANLHRPLMQEVILELLDEWAPKGGFDFEEFASYFPVTVFFKLVGADPALLPSIRSSLEAMGLSVSLEKRFMPAILKAFDHLDEFVHRLIAERRAGRRHQQARDLLDLLLEAQDDGGMTEREMADLLIFLFTAGFDTSKNVLTLAMYELLQRPQMYARCAEDLAFCRKVIDETLRYHSVTTVPRLVTEEIEHRGVRLPKDTTLWFPWAILGRDSSAVANADAFDPEREQKKPHMGFALGPHICLGQFIARAQLEEGLHLLAQRIRKPRSPGPLGWRPFPGVWGIAGLPIAFEPAPAPSPNQQQVRP